MSDFGTLVKPDPQGHMHFDGPHPATGKWEEVEHYTVTNWLGLSRGSRRRRYFGAVMGAPDAVLTEPISVGWSWRGWRKPSRTLRLSEGTWSRGMS